MKKKRYRPSREDKLPKNVDLGLAVLCAHQREGQVFTYDEIGSACGVTESSIFLLEQKALRKVRTLVRYSEKAAALRELTA